MIYESLEYRYPVTKLWTGGSYGNPDCFVRTDAASNLDGCWMAATNAWVVGTVTARWVLTASETRFAPGHQVTTYTGEGIEARVTVFVPYGLPVGQGARVYFGVEVTATRP